MRSFWKHPTCHNHPSVYFFYTISSCFSWEALACEQQNPPGEDICNPTKNLFPWAHYQGAASFTSCSGLGLLTWWL